jgi:6-phosphogluconate dehydrogenase
MNTLPKKQIGIIGLGKMGSAIALHLDELGWDVVGHDISADVAKFSTSRIKLVSTIKELANALIQPRVIWLMVPAGEAVQTILFGKDGLINYLTTDDIVIDGGNSYFEDSVVTAQILFEKKINFLDVGVSNGVEGARHGACLMVGGHKEVYSHLEELFRDIGTEGGYAHVGPIGAGHFVKMVHNGIEYGFIQAIAEGFDIINSCKTYKYDLWQVANLYNHGSLLQSKLMDCMVRGFDKFGNELTEIQGKATGLGEGQWTYDYAKKIGVAAPSIKASLDVREETKSKPNFQGKIIMALRNVFGGHPINP